jgi:hypothetical protein
MKLPNTSLLQCVIVTAATDRGADKRASAFKTFNAAAVIGSVAEDSAGIASAVDLADSAVAAGSGADDEN